jgi:hypothetical protein
MTWDALGEEVLPALRRGATSADVRFYDRPITVLRASRGGATSVQGLCCNVARMALQRELTILLHQRTVRGKEGRVTLSVRVLSHGVCGERFRGHGGEFFFNHSEIFSMVW